MTVKDEYRKERKRIQRFLNRATKRGFIFENNILPAIPKKVTKASVSRLKKLTPDVLYKKARYASELTFGEEISGARGRELERSEAAKRGLVTRKSKQKSLTVEKQEQSESVTPPMLLDNEPDFVPPPVVVISDIQVTENIIAQFKERISHFNQHAQQILYTWLEDLILKYGKTDVAVMLESGAKAGHILTWEVAYDYNKLFSFLSDFLVWLPDMSESEKQQIMQSVQDEVWEGV